jgi:hypothetical protein
MTEQGKKFLSDIILAIEMIEKFSHLPPSQNIQ